MIIPIKIKNNRIKKITTLKNMNYNVNLEDSKSAKY